MKIARETLWLPIATLIISAILVTYQYSRRNAIAEEVKRSERAFTQLKQKLPATAVSKTPDNHDHDHAHGDHDPEKGR